MRTIRIEVPFFLCVNVQAEDEAAAIAQGEDMRNALNGSTEPLAQLTVMTPDGVVWTDGCLWVAEGDIEVIDDETDVTSTPDVRAAVKEHASFVERASAITGKRDPFGTVEPDEWCQEHIQRKPCPFCGGPNLSQEVSNG